MQFQSWQHGHKGPCTSASSHWTGGGAVGWPGPCQLCLVQFHEQPQMAPPRPIPLGVTQSSNKTSTQVRENVTNRFGMTSTSYWPGSCTMFKQTSPGISPQFHFRMLLSSISAALQEQTITHPHDVGFVYSCYLLSPFLSILESIVSHSPTGILCINLIDWTTPSTISCSIPEYSPLESL